MSRVHFAILWSAARLAPGEQRADWLAEWSAELCYVRQRDDRRVTAFCLGAFWDAIWLRRNSPASARGVLRLDSPMQCLGFLAVMAAAAVLLAFRLPGPRDLILPSPYRDAHKLAMISREGQRGSSSKSGPTVSIGEYRALTSPMQQRFTGMAFYSPLRGRIAGTDLSIALASGSLFDLLGLPVRRDRAEAVLVLSDAAVRRDSAIAGHVIEAAGRLVRVAAVIPAASWRLPGGIDAWLIDDQAIAALPKESRGFVVAGLILPQREARSRLSATNSDGRSVHFDAAPLVYRRPILNFLMMAVIAFIVLPATTSLGLGEYPANCRWRRWVFLGVKIALILPMVFFSLLAVGGVAAPHGMLVGYVVAFRWALIDQRQRCPDCLRLLARPTRIGRPSQTFLEWYGMEFVCLKGHGLLHVPEIPTISYDGTQRWMHLDQSWSGLFTTPETQSPPPLRT